MSRINSGNDCCESERPLQGLVSEPCCATEPTTMKKAREVNIQPMDYGYVVRVGCQTFCVESNVKLIKFLDLYLKDPNNTEKMWFDGKLGLSD